MHDLLAGGIDRPDRHHQGIDDDVFPRDAVIGRALEGDEYSAFRADWRRRLYEGGWLGMSWPTEYGGKGLTTMQGVALAEEFARAKAPMRGDFFGDTLVGPTILRIQGLPAPVPDVTDGGGRLLDVRYPEWCDWGCGEEPR